ncbi:HEAT repeat domain-containing protein [Sorangium sp. So ce1389]|uniref:HEAT repeat domain-containing protein n=1 Tax=Sorangium sp. So ce1389 TaxID=3133336 RepID=UPI003F5DD398
MTLMKSKNSRRRAASAAALTLVVVAAMIAIWSHARVRAVVDRSSQALVARYEWPEGKALAYDVELRIEGRSNLVALTTIDATAAERQLGWRGHSAAAHLTLIIMRRARDELAIYVRREKSEARVDDRGTTDEQTMSKRPVVATVDDHGAFKSIRFPSDMAAVTRNNLRHALALAQVRLPEAGSMQSGTEWSITEDAPNGPFQVKYIVAHVDGGHMALVKTVTAAPGARAATAAGRFDGVFDAARGRLLALRGERRLTIAVGGEPVTEETASVALRLTGEVPAPAEAAELATQAGLIMSSDLAGSDELLRAHRRALEKRLGIDGAESLLAQLRANPGASMKELQKTYLKLVALCTLNADECMSLAKELTNFPPVTQAFAAIATALAKVGTPEAQKALVDAMNTAASDPEVVVRLLPHLAMVERPTLESEQYVHRLAQEGGDAQVRGTAWLALGSIGHHARAEASARAVQIGRELGEQLASATNDEERQLFLGALGNVGEPSQLEGIVAYLDHDDTLLRERAVNALRFIEAPAARDALMRKAADDVNDIIRARAVEAMSFTSSSADDLALYRRLLRQESSVPVVREALRNVSLLAHDEREARHELADFVRRCGHQDLCSYARGLLNALPSSAPGPR